MPASRAGVKRTIFWPSRPPYASKRHGQFYFQILDVAIHNRLSRRTNAEQDLFQGGFAPNLPCDPFPDALSAGTDGEWPPKSWAMARSLSKNPPFRLLNFFCHHEEDVPEVEVEVPIEQTSSS